VLDRQGIHGCAPVFALGLTPRHNIHTVVRERLRTCRMCTTPVDGFELCWRCYEHCRGGGVADAVAPLIYAVAGSESADLLRQYKNHPNRAMRERCSSVLAELLRLVVSLHRGCFGHAVGIAVSQHVVIPSLTSRPGIHPLTSVADSVGLLGDVALIPAADARCDRVISADKFIIEPAGSVIGQHVLVLDDVWTTGSNAQSAALSLRRAGATAVSVLVIGRWLSAGKGLNARFIEDLGGGYDPLVCPVTGNRCGARVDRG